MEDNLKVSMELYDAIKILIDIETLLDETMLAIQKNENSASKEMEKGMGIFLEGEYGYLGKAKPNFDEFSKNMVDNIKRLSSFYSICSKSLNTILDGYIKADKSGAIEMAYCTRLYEDNKEVIDELIANNEIT